MASIGKKDVDRIIKASKGLLEYNGSEWIIKGTKKTFKTPFDAMGFIQSLGISTIETYAPNKRLGEYMITSEGISTGGALAGPYREFAQRSGHTITIHRIGTKGFNQDALEHNFKVGGTWMGILNPNKDHPTFETWADSSGRALTEAEIIAQRRLLGASGIVKAERLADDTLRAIKSPAKRITADTARRPLFSVMPEGLNYNIGVYNPVEVGRRMGRMLTEKEAELASDGLAIMNPATARRFHADLMSRIAEAENDVKHFESIGELEKARTIKNSVRTLRDEAQNLAKTIKTGGRYNVRATGVNIIKSGDISEDLSWARQLKGDVILPSTDAEWRRAARAAGYEGTEHEIMDFLTSPGALTKEYGLEDVLGLKGVARATLDPRHQIKGRFLDDQTLTAHPYLFADLERLKRETVAAFQADLDSVVKTGVLPQGFERELRNILGAGIQDQHLITNSSISFNYARAILDHIDENGGSVANNPDIMKTVIEGMKMYYEDGKAAGRNGSIRSRLLSGSQQRAEIAGSQTLDMLRYDGLETPMQAGEGYMSYSRKYESLIYNDKDVIKAYDPHGGFDFDDLINSHVRYNPEDKTFYAINVRSPTTEGEHYVVKIRGDDDLINEVVRSRPGGIDYVGHIEKELAEVERLTRRRNILDLQRGGLKEGSLEFRELSKQIEGLHEAIKGLKARGIASGIGEQVPQGFMGRYTLDELNDGALDAAMEARHAYIRNLMRHAAESDDVVQHISTAQLDVIKKRSMASQALMHNGGIGDLPEDARLTMNALYQRIGEEVDSGVDDITKNMFTGLKPESVSKVLTETKAWSNEFAFQVQQAMEKGNELIGMYSNTKMLLDDAVLSMEADDKAAFDFIRNMTWKSGDETISGLGAFSIPSLERVIDQSVTGVGSEVFHEKIRYRIGEMMAEAEIQSNGAHRFKLDKTLLGERGGEKKDMLAGYHARIRANGRKVDDFDIKSNYADLQFSRGTGAAKSAAARIQQLTDSAKASFKYNEFYDSHLFDAQAHEDASLLGSIYKKAQRTHSGDFGLTDEARDFFVDFGVFDAPGASEARRSVASDVMAAVKRMHSDEGGSSQRVLNALGVLKQMYNDSGEYAGIFSLPSVGDTSMLDLSNAADRFFVNGEKPHLSMLEAVNRESSLVDDTTTAFFGGKRLERATKDYESARAIFKDINMSTVKEAFEHPGIQKVAVGVLGAVVGSVLYQRHRDRTYEQMEGPALLPGGSAYEDRQVEPMARTRMNSNSSALGTTYTIHASGDFDHKAFAGEVGSTTGVTPNVNVYNARKFKRNSNLDSYVENNF